MNSIADFLTRHWLSLLLFAGIVTAVWYVYKNRDKLLIK